MSGPFTRYGCLFFEWEPIRFLDTTALKVWQVIYTRADIPGLWHVDLPDVASKSFLSNEATLKALDILRDQELVEFDRQHRMLRLTKFPDAGEWPASPYVLAGWWKIFQKKMPDCRIRNSHVPLIRWLLDEGAKKSDHPDASQRPSPKHEETWAQTFGTIRVPTAPVVSARSFADSDTSTMKQPSLFGVRGGIPLPDTTGGDPIRMGSPIPLPTFEATVDEFSIHQEPSPSTSYPNHNPRSSGVGSPIPLGEGEGARREEVGVGDLGSSGSGLAPVIVLDPSSRSRAKPIGPSLAEQDRDRQVSLVVRTIQHEHVQAFLRAKAVTGSRAFGPKVTEDCPELRELVHGMVDLSDAIERCRYALEIRELEAGLIGSVMYLGPAMWKRPNFEKALTMDPADLRAKAQPAGSVTRPGGRSALGAANAYFDHLSETESRGS